jgi:hypothetical protein
MYSVSFVASDFDGLGGNTQSCKREFITHDEALAFVDTLVNEQWTDDEGYTCWVNFSDVTISPCV